MEKDLFISDPVLGKALLEIKSMCILLSDFSFIDAIVIEKLVLFDFAEMQVNSKFY